MRAKLLTTLIFVGAFGACQTTPPPETREQMAERAKAACPTLVSGDAYYTASQCECVTKRITRLAWDSETSSYSGEPMLYEDAKFIADTMENGSNMTSALSVIRGNVSQPTATSIGSCFPSK